jgi:hypothetical protein
VAESQCALLGKSTNLLIAIERPVWLTGRQRQQKAGHCDLPSAKTAVFLAAGGQVIDPARFSERQNRNEKAARPG